MRAANVEAIAGVGVRSPSAVHAGAARLGALRPGAIVFALGTDLPEPLRPYVSGFEEWQVVEAGLATEFHSAAAAAGHLFSFIAEPIEAAAVAFDTQRAVAAAVGKLFRTAAQFEAVEIASVSSRRFAGLVRVKITAYRRQVRPQPELSFDDSKIAAMGERIEQTARRFRHAHGSDAALSRLADAPISHRS